MGENRLKNATSPYLRQHQTNPVWWQEWSKKVFDRALLEDKPLFLSIGYSTCHWCHVMEGDSFEKQDVADFLNQHFISVKIDREERPDIDDIYMDFLHATGQRGGWPLSVFVTPQGRPFFGGTFIPHDDFLRLLQNIANLWQSKDRDKLILQSQEIVNHLKHSRRATDPKTIAEINVMKTFILQMKDAYQPHYGGFSPAPKFPSCTNSLALLRLYRRCGLPETMEMPIQTLEYMVKGGIFDHLGGGFHRYATDAEWIVPHFEKMLYDNALLLWVMVEGFQLTQATWLKQAALKTADYLIAEMTQKEGGFYAAEDADSEKTEGKYYVWHYDEVKSLLSDDEFQAIVSFYGLTPEGNFNTMNHSPYEVAAGLKGVHQGNILFLSGELDLTEEHLLRNRVAGGSGLLHQASQKLLASRDKRIRPFLDDKILCSWNGLAIGALVRAGRAFGEPQYLKEATAAADFIEANMVTSDFVHRSFCRGQAGGRGMLEDYANLIHGLIELYQGTFIAKYYELALKIQALQDKLFWQESEQLYYDSDGTDSTLLYRGMTLHDNVVPSGNATTAYNLLRLHKLSYEDHYKQRAEAIFSRAATPLARSPQAYGMLLIAIDFYFDLSKEVAIAGDLNSVLGRTLLAAINSHYAPNIVLAGGSGPALLKDKTSIADAEACVYVCQDQSCDAPTADVEELLHNLSLCKTLEF